MPELPEVETLKRELAVALAGKVIKSVKIFSPETITPLTAAVFNRRLKGQRIESVARRAKILFFNLFGGETLAVHLKLTGQLIFMPHHQQGSTLRVLKVEPFKFFKYTRAILNFTDGSQLYFNDLRKFGWLRLLSAKHKQELNERHGLEPLASDFTLKNFTTQLLHYPNRRLKQTLLDQTLVAGLGNIYTDESCFASRVRPTRQIKTLTPGEIKKLYSSIKKILRLAIKKGGTSAKDYVRSDGTAGDFVPHLKVYGRGQLSCKNCGMTIVKIKLAGRGTHFCPKCQK